MSLDCPFLSPPVFSNVILICFIDSFDCIFFTNVFAYIGLLTLIKVLCGFEPWSDKNNDYEINGYSLFLR